MVHEHIEVVVADGDPKLTALRRDSRCLFLAFDTAPPFAGMQVRAQATLVSRGVRAARAEIGARYLGEESGRRWAAERTRPGVIVRLPRSAARTWDLGAMLAPYLGE